MKPIVLNWDEIEKEGSFEPIPIGPYEVAITKVELKQSKEQKETHGESGYPYFNLELTILSGEHAKRKLWDIWSLNPTALPFGLGRNLPVFGVDRKGTEEYSTYEELTQV